MLSEKAEAAIDRLSVDELRYEVELGRASRFPREKFAYMNERRTDAPLRCATAAEAGRWATMQLP